MQWAAPPSPEIKLFVLPATHTVRSRAQYFRYVRNARNWCRRILFVEASAGPRKSRAPEKKLHSINLDRYFAFRLAFPSMLGRVCVCVCGWWNYPRILHKNRSPEGPGHIRNGIKCCDRNLGSVRTRTLSLALGDLGAQISAVNRATYYIV